MQQMILLFVFPLLGNTVLTSLSGGDLVQQFREACPYTNMCTFTSLEVLNDTKSSRPCCMDCFCDSICSTYDDCCPDVMDTTNKTDMTSIDPAPVCKTSAWRNLYTAINSDRFFDVLPRYRMIDDCPSDYNGDDMIRERCRGNFNDDPSYDDIVHVSDRSSRLFQNKHCAMCNNAQGVTRWDLKAVSCQDDIGDMQFTPISLYKYVLKNCAVVSTRPHNVPLNSRTMACHVESTCPHEFEDEETKNGCLYGPYIPFTVVNQFFSQFWKNFMCFKCRIFGEANNICPNDIEDVDLSFEKSILFQLDLNLENQITDQKDFNCSEMETFDHHLGSCRRLYCPPLTVTSRGKCLPISRNIESYVISVNLIFIPESNTPPILHYVKPYNRTKVKEFYTQYICSITTSKSCSPFLFYVFVSTGKSSGYLESVRILLHYEMNTNCSRDDIKSLIEQTNAKFLFKSWAINKMLPE